MACRVLFEDDGCSKRGTRQVDSGTWPVQMVEAETSAVTGTAIVNAGSGRTQDDTTEGDQYAGAAQTCIDSLNDDLEIYNDMGGDDREMCGMMKNGLANVAKLWTDIQREFHQALATSVYQVDND